MIDRELYLPKSWTSDPARCVAVGVPDDVAFATKPKLAQIMLARALDAGVPARWVAADEVYGADPGLRADLEAREVGYVLAIDCDRRGPPQPGRCVPTRWPPACPRVPGSDCRPARGLILQRQFRSWRSVAAASVVAGAGLVLAASAPV
jgi:hypothetical protein